MLYIGNENVLLYIICHDSKAIYSLSTQQLLNVQQVKLPTVFTGYADTTSTLKGGGWRMIGITKWQHQLMPFSGPHNAQQS